jgi:hypothetical protein
VVDGRPHPRGPMLQEAPATVSAAVLVPAPMLHRAGMLKPISSSHAFSSTPSLTS